jgi:phosphatidylglycerol lysyltransferase
MAKRKYTVAFQSSLVAFIGLCLIVQPFLSFIGEHLRYSRIVWINPLGISPSLLLTLMGVTLMYLVPYLYRGRKIAYMLSTVLVVIASAILVRQHVAFLVLVMVLGTALWLVFSHDQYKVRSDMIRLQFGLRTAAIAAGIGYLYGFLGFFVLGPLAFHQLFSLQQSLVLSLQALFTLSSLDAPTSQAELFIHSIDVISGLIFILVVTSLFKPVRFALGAQKKDWEQAEEILRATSRSSEDYFKLWPGDKHYFFSPSRQSFLAYKTSGGTAIILGDPSGDANEFGQLITGFRYFVTSNGWRVAIINATDITKQLVEGKKFHEQFIGNEAVISIQNFIKRTAHSKHFRYVTNKAERDGLLVDYLHRPSDSEIQLLRKISDAWLSKGGRKEYSFFMGYFDEAYLKAGTVILLRQYGEAIAYVSILPSFIDDEVSIDHLRLLPETSPVAMHFLLLELIRMEHKAGKKTLNIGLAPLSGIELEDNQNSISDKVLVLVKKFGNRYYSFKGVEQFKGKSDPIWYPRYLYYTGSVASLPLIARDIEQAASRFYDRTRKRKIIGVVVIVALLAALVQFL